MQVLVHGKQYRKPIFFIGFDFSNFDFLFDFNGPEKAEVGPNSLSAWTVKVQK